MAEGRSNTAIAQRLFITEKAVSKHTTSIFIKLGLAADQDDNRRVLAVLAYQNSGGSRPGCPGSVRRDEPRRRDGRQQPQHPADEGAAGGAGGRPCGSGGGQYHS